MRWAVTSLFVVAAMGAGVLLAEATPSTTPATSPAAPADAVTLAEQLRTLLPAEYADLRPVGHFLKQHELEAGRMWETKANYVIRDRSKGIAAALAGRTGTVAIFDYLAAPPQGKERPWVPRSQGMPLFPYLQAKPDVTEEKVGTRPARMLSADDLGGRRLVVRANERFDVVFALRPGDDGAAVPLDELRGAAERFDWAKLDALREVPAAYAGPQVAPPRQ